MTNHKIKAIWRSITWSAIDSTNLRYDTLLWPLATSSLIDSKNSPLTCTNQNIFSSCTPGYGGPLFLFMLSSPDCCKLRLGCQEVSYMSSTQEVNNESNSPTITNATNNLSILPKCLCPRRDPGRITFIKPVVTHTCSSCWRRVTGEMFTSSFSWLSKS